MKYTQLITPILPPQLQLLMGYTSKQLDNFIIVYLSSTFKPSQGICGTKIMEAGEYCITKTIQFLTVHCSLPSQPFLCSMSTQADAIYNIDPSILKQEVLLNLKVESLEQSPLQQELPLASEPIFSSTLVVK